MGADSFAGTIRWLKTCAKRCGTQRSNILHKMVRQLLDRLDLGKLGAWNLDIHLAHRRRHDLEHIQAIGAEITERVGKFEVLVLNVLDLFDHMFSNDGNNFVSGDRKSTRLNSSHV